MDLPDELREAIAEEIISQNTSKISRAREELSARYRNQKSDHQYMVTDSQRLSYLITRMPATYAAVHAVLRELTRVGDRLQTELRLDSLLDLGSGPGTGMWAAQEIFPQIRHIHLLEQDAALISLGKRLARKSGISAINKAEWRQVNLETPVELPTSDLVLHSYSIGEISESVRNSLLEKSWQAAQQFLVIIEPGTPVGFERLRIIRDKLIEWGGNIVAPCPHANKCPMSGSDWCHFSIRLQRSSLHRQMKQGVLGHEDEKFSYLIFSKKNYDLFPNRILRHPNKRTGHIHFTLCTPNGIEQKIISKRAPELYKKAKELGWGDYL